MNNKYKPLSFKALEDGLSISMSNNILYSIDGGVWNSLGRGEFTEEVSKNSVISFKEVTEFMGDGTIGAFTINKKCNVYGDCSSILPSIYNNDFIKYELYMRLFAECENIIDASELILPATTLATNCYYQMFSGCTSLVNAPELPATTLATDCYKWMFSGCKKLNYVKMLATDISASNCLSNWVSGVASTGTFVKNKNMTSLTAGSSGIPEGWTVINV